MDALWEWMESDLGVIMVGTWRLCERTETATTKRRMTRKNAIKTAFPAENALNNSKTSSFGPEKSKIATQAKSGKKQQRTQKQRTHVQKPEENACCRPKPRNSNIPNIITNFLSALCFSWDLIRIPCEGGFESGSRKRSQQPTEFPDSKVDDRNSHPATVTDYKAVSINHMM